MFVLFLLAAIDIDIDDNNDNDDDEKLIKKRMMMRLGNRSIWKEILNFNEKKIQQQPNQHTHTQKKLTTNLT